MLKELHVFLSLTQGWIFLKLYFHPSIHLFFIKSFLFYLFIFFSCPTQHVESHRKQAPCSGRAGPPEKSHGQILHRICLYNAKPVYLAIDNYVLLPQNIDYCSNSVLMWLSIMFITQHKDDVKNLTVQWYRDFKEEKKTGQIENKIFGYSL